MSWSIYPFQRDRPTETTVYLCVLEDRLCVYICFTILLLLRLIIEIIIMMSHCILCLFIILCKDAKPNKMRTYTLEFLLMFLFIKRTIIIIIIPTQLYDTCDI